MRPYFFSLALLAFVPLSRVPDRGVEGLGGPRRPVALAVSEDGDYLFVANRRTGTISVLSARTFEIEGEHAVAESLSDLAFLPGVGLLALDDHAYALLRMEGKGNEIRVSSREALSPYPARLALDVKNRRAFVASSWSRRLDVIDLNAAEARRSTIEMPFSPREMLPVGEVNRIIVADAFGGRLATVNVERGAVERVIEIPGHNIRGLAIEGNRLLLTHQRVEKSAHTEREELIWGVFITNALLSLDLDALLDQDSPEPIGRGGGAPRQEPNDVLRSRRVIDLGGQVIPSGDPDRVLVTGAGEVVVTLAGVGRVAMGMTSWPRLDHVKSGRRPTALALGSDGRLFVANTHSDSIGVIGLAERKVLAEVALGPAVDLGAADRGEVLFYDASVSLRGWMSCHSCHTEGHTSGIVADTQGDGSYGAPKRVPSLLGVHESGPWAWNGQMKTLSAQIEKSLRSTLHASPVTLEQVTTLEAYLATLEPPALAPDADPESVRRGETLFLQRCATCHAPPSFTSDSTYDVGFADEVGQRRFNPPSLRGSRYRSVFFHDGRARSLEDVLVRHRHPAGALPDAEVQPLIAYLKSL